MSKVITSQSKEWLLNRLIATNLYKTANAQDFLATCKSDLFGETERYFFRHISMMQFKEIRIFKESKRVSVSIKRTKK